MDDVYLELQRYHLALHRIANLQHDQACSTPSCPVEECGCYEKGPRELAQMALDGIDWQPAPRKERALALFGVPPNPTAPWERRVALLRSALEQLDPSAFDRIELHSAALVTLALQHLTEDQSKKLADIVSEEVAEDCCLAGPGSDLVEQLPYPQLPLIRCAADRDGDCFHPQCPQKRDGEPGRSGRHCPVDIRDDGDENGT